jgi:hypothetical protein
MMLGRLVLFLVQLGVGYFGGQAIIAKIPSFGRLDIFIYAVAFAIIVWLLGFIGSVVLKDVAQPSPATLTVALVGALIGAGLTLVPQVTSAVSGLVRGGIPTLVYPLIGAVLGYAIRR